MAKASFMGGLLNGQEREGIKGNIYCNPYFNSNDYWCYEVYNREFEKMDQPTNNFKHYRNIESGPTKEKSPRWSEMTKIKNEFEEYIKTELTKIGKTKKRKTL